MKTEMPLDKHQWQPSPLPGQVVLVTTLDGTGRPSVATKSWISMAAFGPPPILMFGCNHRHATAKNIQIQREFVINVPGEDLAKACWAVGSDEAIPGTERFERNGLTLLPSTSVGPPRIAECRAHLECTLEDVKAWGEEVVFFGQIVAVSIDADALGGEPSRRYETLRPFFFLENDLLAGLSTARSIARPKP